MLKDVFGHSARSMARALKNVGFGLQAIGGALLALLISPWQVIRDILLELGSVSVPSSTSWAFPRARSAKARRNPGRESSPDASSLPYGAGRTFESGPIAILYGYDRITQNR